MSTPCPHESVLGLRDHSRCRTCDAFRTDSFWGVASHRWFVSRAEAEFFRVHGRLPDPPPAPPVVDEAMIERALKAYGRVGTDGPCSSADYARHVGNLRAALQAALGGVA